jgi:hypothetical protein
MCQKSFPLKIFCSIAKSGAEELWGKKVNWDSTTHNFNSYYILVPSGIGTGRHLAIK